MFVRDLMTSPATSLPTGTRLDAAITALATQRITAVPMVDARHHKMGIVTEAEVVIGPPGDPADESGLELRRPHRRPRAHTTP